MERHVRLRLGPESMGASTFVVDLQYPGCWMQQCVTSTRKSKASTSIGRVDTIRSITRQLALRWRWTH